MSLHDLMLVSSRNHPADPVIAVMEALPGKIRERIEDLRDTDGGTIHPYQFFVDIYFDAFEEVIGDPNEYDRSSKRIVGEAFTRFIGEHPIWEGMQLYQDRYREEAQLFVDWSEATTGYGAEVRAQFDQQRDRLSAAKREQIVAGGAEVLKSRYRKYLGGRFEELAREGRFRGDLTCKTGVWEGGDASPPYSGPALTSLPSLPFLPVPSLPAAAVSALQEEEEEIDASSFPTEIIRRFLAEQIPEEGTRIYLEGDTVWVDWSTPLRSDRPAAIRS